MQGVAVAAVAAGQFGAAAAAEAAAGVRTALGLDHSSQQHESAAAAAAVPGSHVSMAAVTPTSQAITPSAGAVANRPLSTGVQEYSLAKQTAATAANIAANLQQALEARTNTVSIASVDLDMNSLQVLRLANNVDRNFGGKFL